MKCFASFVCFLSALVLVRSAPFLPGGFSASTSLQLGGGGAGSSGSSGSSSAGGGLTNILSNIDLPGLLRGVNSFVKLVGVVCPPLSQVLDNVIQNVTSIAFRVIGRAVLQNGGLGGGGGGGGAGGGQKVSVVLPTFPPDEEDDDDEEDNEDSSAQLVSRIGESSSESEPDSSESSSTAAPVADVEATTPSNKEAEDSPANAESNLIAKRHVRVAREAGDDQDGAESAPQPAEDLANVDVDDQDRNKRFSPFGGSVEGQASVGGSGGGSGNFLFDIIRLVAGSGATEETDEKANAPGGVAEIDISKTVDSGEGVPGPITRMFVLANRGIANLVQDLILRLAQTSERLVNFKARLVTALI